LSAWIFARKALRRNLSKISEEYSRKSVENRWVSKISVENI